MTVQWVLDLVLLFLQRNGFIFEIVIATLIYTYRLERRRRGVFWGGVVLVVMLAQSVVWNRYARDSPWLAMVDNLVVFLLLALWIAVIWRVDLRQDLLYFVLGGTTQHLCYRGATMVTLISTDRVSASFRPSVYGLALIPMLLCSYLLWARKLKNHREIRIQGQSLLATLAGMFLCVSVFTNVINAIRPPIGPRVTGVFSAFDMLACILLLSLCIGLEDKQEARYEGELLRQLLRQQRRQMSASKETIELVNVKAHDLKKQITQYGQALSSDQMNSLTNLVDVYDASVHTGNDALDVLLTQKALVCERRGIRFDRMIDGALLGFMNPTDVYALFGNAMDNALEALAGFEPKDGRYISLDVKKRVGMVLIRVENPFPGEIRFLNGLPMTTKGDERDHGFGLRSMSMIAKRYHGKLFIKAEDHLFILTIVLPSAS